MQVDVRQCCVDVRKSDVDASACVDQFSSMAVGVAIAKTDGNHYTGRITSFVVFSCVIAATGGMIFGYDNGVTGLKRFNLAILPLYL
ncbi:hypothetical protein M569_01777 [Genlisea aurea]|uniref:Major facilitator superfamily (MFS) profile domain-containing protein n=1 Tax=Genlisea aurea TaxID=192259 RepID=S8CZQ9_9LAMI|nr:hypothetical protein M569_01777 [Genlisea aurea]